MNTMQKAQALLNQINSTTKKDALNIVFFFIERLEAAEHHKFDPTRRSCNSCQSNTHVDYWRSTNFPSIEACPVCHRKQRI